MRETPLTSASNTQFDAYTEHRAIVDKINNNEESLDKRLEIINNLESQLQGMPSESAGSVGNVSGEGNEDNRVESTEESQLSPDQIDESIRQIDEPDYVNEPLTLNEHGIEAVKKDEENTNPGGIIGDFVEGTGNLLSPLTVFGSGIAPLANPSQAEDFSTRIGEDFSTMLQEMKRRALPGLDPEQETSPEHSRALVERIMPGAPKYVKDLSASTIELVSDPTIVLGLPFAKVIQKGLLVARSAEIAESGAQTFKGIVQEGLAELLAGGGSANIDPKSMGEIGTIAQKIDEGTASPEEITEFNRLIGEDINVIREAERAEREGLEEIQGTITEKLGDTTRPAFEVLDELETSLETTRQSISSDTLSANIHLNYAKLTSDEDVTAFLQEVTDVYKERFRAAVGHQTNEETIELAQDQQLSDLLGKKVHHFSAEDAYALRQTLLASGQNLVRLATRANGANATNVDNIAFNKALAVHLAIHEKVLGVKGQAGRLLQSFNISAEGDLASINKQIDQLATFGKMDSKARKVLKEMLSTTTPSEAHKIVSNVKDSKLLASLFEVFTNAILSGPVTHAVNISSNALNLAWAPTQSFVEGMSAAARLDFREASIKGAETTARLTGMAHGISDAFRHAARSTRLGKSWEELNIPTDMRGQSEIEGYRYRKAITSENMEINGPMAPLVDYLGKFIRIPGAALVEEDIAFKIVHYRMETAAQAARKAATTQGTAQDKLRVFNTLKNNPLKSMVDQSVDVAEHYTFTKNLGKTGTAFNKAISSNYATKFSIPFFRTPTNIVKQGARNGIWGNIFKDLIPALTKGGPEADTVRAKIAMGTMVPFTAMSMLDDRITGRIDPSTAEGRFKIQNGIPAYSIKIGDEWHSYEKIEPLRSILGLLVNTKEAMHNTKAIDPVTGEENPYYSDLVTNVTGAFINTMGDTYMIEAIGGMLDIVDGVSTGNPDYALQKFQQISANMVVPQFVAQINREHFDKNMRMASTYLEQIQRRIPNLAPLGVEGSTSLPHNYTLWGDIQLYPEGLGPDIISSIRTKTKEPDWVDKEIVRLIDDYNLSIPNEPPREITAPATGLGVEIKLELSSKQRAQFQLLRGKGVEGGASLKEIMMEMMNSSAYQQAADIDKRNQVAERLIDATKIAKEYMFGHDEDLQTQFEDKKRALLRQRERTQQ